MRVSTIPAAVMLVLGLPVEGIGQEPPALREATAGAPGSGLLRQAGTPFIDRRAATLAGRIIRHDGTAAEHARVVVYAIDRATGSRTPMGSATSAFDGRYEVTGLPPGEFFVGATPATTSAPPATETLYPGVADGEPGRPVSLFEGISTEGIDIWLMPWAQRFMVSGRVFAPDARGLDNLTIEYGGATIGRPSVWFVDDPGGLFTLYGIPPGTLFLLARADSDDGPLVGLVSTDVSVDSVEDVRIVLGPPGSVEGRLVFEGTRPSAGDLRVSARHTWLDLSSLYPAEEAHVSQDGRFEIRHVVGEHALDVKGLPAGWSVLRVLQDGRPTLDNRLVIRAGERLAQIDVVVGRQD